MNSITKSAYQKIVFFCAKKYFTPHQVLMIYKAQIRSVLLKLLDFIQRKAVYLVGDSSFTNSLTSLEHRKKVGDLTLFHRFHFMVVALLKYLQLFLPWRYQHG